MNKTLFWKQFLIFALAFFLVLYLRSFIASELIEHKITSYKAHTLLGLVINALLIALSYFFIRKNQLEKLAGLKDLKAKKKYLLIFPVVYLILLNVLISDDIDLDKFVPNLLLFTIYALSIGFAEELSIRGFIQSLMIRFFGKNKKGVVFSVLASALFFGLIHILKFDKGLYGELSQVFFATFIGLMFGFLLLIVKRIYPLIIAHALIDFVAKLDRVGWPIEEQSTEAMSFENAVIIVLLVLPCLIYGIFLAKKYPLVKH
ncbi:CPBP family intramembrane glutamic endopeptidase [uncultured Croceitalea sp.]|uniref:CPBP family intramembrane glutamic endopeptidase n=1 Tax=uncultured Croceitalea sp. TaxID=1798908 RepID=UPI003305C784